MVFGTLLLSFYRYDKFRKSDKKVKNGDIVETEANVADTATEKKNTEISTPA